MDFRLISHLNVGIKISLEDEGLTFDQATQIACQTHSNNIPITLKIGGAEAISDMRFAKTIGCTGCVAPMIESKFALHKFISANQTNQFDFKNLYINIESKQAYYNIEEIVNSKDIKYLSGIVLGRSDFIQSFDKTKSDTDSNECFKMAKKIFSLAKSNNLTTLMGGNINNGSKKFITDLFKADLLDYVETRNVKVKLGNDFLKNYKINLSKILEFEKLILEEKANTLDLLSDKDKKRLQSLRTRSN